MIKKIFPPVPIRLRFSPALPPLVGFSTCYYREHKIVCFWERVKKRNLNSDHPLIPSLNKEGT